MEGTQNIWDIMDIPFLNITVDWNVSIRKKAEHA